MRNPIIGGTVVLLFIVIPLLLLWVDSPYIGRLAQLVLITAILASALNLLTGTAGLLAIDAVVYYGLGAYTAAILSVNHGSGFLVDVAVAVTLAGVLSAIVGYALVRLSSIFFAVATMGLTICFHTTVLNWGELTRGPMGYRGIPPVRLFGYELHGWFQSYLAAAVMCFIALFIAHRLMHSFYGNAVRAAREDEESARALGLSSRRLKTEVYVIHAMLMAAAGALYAHTNQFIGPDNFVLLESALILIGIVVGGLGSWPGIVIGALIMVLVPEFLREIGNLRALVFGLVLFFSILFLPRGLFSEVRALAVFRRTMKGSPWARREGRS
ncbi:MAG: branched-chain amino acid ABC transporter permease [Ottowia sp.]|uniref:branched-chain amino acid ABC transporter permease n=1 Tax=Ottowia sp. TaxID=1898956 RepID=UPI0039E40B32